MTLLNLIKLVFQAVCNPDDFRDSVKCREFVKNVLVFARSVSEKNEIEIDEKILDQLDIIVASDELWKYCYTLVSCWFGAESDKGIEIDTDADGKPIFKPEGISCVTAQEQSGTSTSSTPAKRA